MKKSCILFLFATLFFAAQAQTEFKHQMIVAHDGSGDFTKIQDAIDATKAFPDTRITIFVKNGVYKEKVLVPSANHLLAMIGEDAEKTVITWDDYFDKIGRGRNSTFFTYTFKVEADDFYAENLTIENAAGPVGQAVALHVEGNRCAFKNCRILGNQDTVYLHGENSNHYFSGCVFEGTTDFIFGSATAVFSYCVLYSKSGSYVTAASTTAGKLFGFVFINCKLLPKEGAKQVYLGRPWRAYAKVAFIRCEMGNHIRPEGWHNWDNPGVEQTSFFAEHNSTGTGANTAKRVNWSHQLSIKEAEKYTLENILGSWVNQLTAK